MSPRDSILFLLGSFFLFPFFLSDSIFVYFSNRTVFNAEFESHMVLTQFCVTAVVGSNCVYY